LRGTTSKEGRLVAEDHSQPIRAAVGDALGFCRRTWWMFLIGGVASVLFGILAFISPASALLVLALYFAAFVAVDGVSSVVGSIANRGQDGWLFTLIFGVLAVLVGIYALLNPEISITAFVFLVGFMATAAGVLMLALGWRVRKASEKEWILYALGISSLIFGLLLFIRPLEGAESLVFLVATWAVLTGALRVWFAFWVKGTSQNVAERIRTSGGAP
jgi:uncharacterized membrane protein HdeD (DUF308 family)